MKLATTPSSKHGSFTGETSAVGLEGSPTNIKDSAGAGALLSAAAGGALITIGCLIMYYDVRKVVRFVRAQRARDAALNDLDVITFRTVSGQPLN